MTHFDMFLKIAPLDPNQEYAFAYPEHTYKLTFTDEQLERAKYGYMLFDLDMLHFFAIPGHTSFSLREGKNC